MNNDNEEEQENSNEEGQENSNVPENPGKNQKLPAFDPNKMNL